MKPSSVDDWHELLRAICHDGGWRLGHDSLSHWSLASKSTAPNLPDGVAAANIDSSQECDEVCTVNGAEFRCQQLCQFEPLFDARQGTLVQSSQRRDRPVFMRVSSRSGTLMHGGA
jgi:hypothetical protein